MIPTLNCNFKYSYTLFLPENTCTFIYKCYFLYTTTIHYIDKNILRGNNYKFLQKNIGKKKKSKPHFISFSTENV